MNELIGKIVHYVLESERSEGQHRPAIVVRDWKKEDGSVNLQVFTDGINDGFVEFIDVVVNNGEAAMLSRIPHILWKPSVPYSETKEPGTWHWIEEEE